MGSDWGGWPIHINKRIESLLVGIWSEGPKVVLQAPSLQLFEAASTAVDRSLDLRNLNPQWVEADDQENVSFPEHAPLASPTRRYTSSRCDCEGFLHNRSGRSRNRN